MTPTPNQDVAEQRFQITVTLSPMAYEEMSKVAESKGIPLATHLRQILEAHHETPSYGNLVKRANARISGEQWTDS